MFFFLFFFFYYLVTLFRFHTHMSGLPHMFSPAGLPILIHNTLQLRAGGLPPSIPLSSTSSRFFILRSPPLPLPAPATFTRPPVSCCPSSSPPLSHLVTCYWIIRCRQLFIYQAAPAGLPRKRRDGWEENGAIIR